MATPANVPTIPQNTSDEAVDALVAAAVSAVADWPASDRAGRARLLGAIADGLEARRAELVAIAKEETHLPDARLNGELTRTTFQLRIFAEVILDGGYLDARIDPADADWPMGAPRPELRRIKLPVGPVVNYAASNFPFAFSVAGGDTASALAAGCPVIVKANNGHLRLSAATAEVIAAAVAETGAPAGVFGILYGRPAGLRALAHPDVAAGSFTGSTAGGRALFDLAASRPTPIPFFGELGSVNPVFVTPAAAAARPAEIAKGLTAAVCASAGQLCTKPGILAVPADSGVIAAAAEVIGTVPTGELLNEHIARGFTAAVEAISAHEGVEFIAGGGPGQGSLLAVDAAVLLADPETLMQEMFGPATLAVRYRDIDELFAVARAVEGQLSASVFAENDDEHAAELIAIATTKAGRVLWNGWSTGVSVTYAQQHGGPYPATTAPGTTSVGTAAIERFLRPVTFQSLPQDLLPPELRDDADVPQTTNGVPRR